jgi:hypothetical protein
VLLMHRRHRDDALGPKGLLFKCCGSTGANRGGTNGTCTEACCRTRPDRASVALLVAVADTPAPPADLAIGAFSDHPPCVPGWSSLRSGPGGPKSRSFGRPRGRRWPSSSGTGDPSGHLLQTALLFAEPVSCAPGSTARSVGYRLCI